MMYAFTLGTSVVKGRGENRREMVLVGRRVEKEEEGRVFFGDGRDIPMVDVGENCPSIR